MAVAALHALATHDNIDRVAIVDIDVHHGNGTQDVLSRLPAEAMPRRADGRKPKDVFFASLHLYDTDQSLDTDEYRFYPGSGAGEFEDLFANTLNVALQPLWSLHPPKGSVAGAAGAHGAMVGSPATAAPAGADPSPGTGPAAPRHRRGSTAHSDKEPLPLPCGRVQYRQQVSHRLLPALRAAAPDLIIVSAGFDAGKRDVGNSRVFSDDR